MFRMIGYGENIGSGFPLILNAWNEKHWIEPELVEQPELMQVKLIFHIQNEPVNDPKVDPKVDPINDPINLTKRQKDILGLISLDGTLSREEIARKLKLSDTMVKRELAMLKEKGVLVREGSKKAGHWIIKM